MRHFRILYERLIRRVKQDHRVLLIGVCHPLGQLVPGIGRPRRIVRRTQIDHIHLLLRIRHRQKSIVPICPHIEDPRSIHDIGVAIDRIHRVRNEHRIITVQ